MRDATFSDGDFKPRSYAESVACDVPDNRQPRLRQTPCSPRSLQQE